MSNHAECCETCRFWDTGGLAGDGDVPGNSGDCRRRAPQIVMAQTPALLADWSTIRGDGPHAGKVDIDPADEARRVWPLTYSWDWCGEWQPLTPPPADG